MPPPAMPMARLSLSCCSASREEPGPGPASPSPSSVPSPRLSFCGSPSSSVPLPEPGVWLRRLRRGRGVPPLPLAPSVGCVRLVACGRRVRGGWRGANV